MKMKEILDIVSGKEIYVNDSHVYDIDFKNTFGSNPSVFKVILISREACPASS